MIHTQNFGLRQEWVFGWINLLNEKREFTQQEIENGIGMGPRQTPAFLIWMKGLGLMEKRGELYRPTDLFDTYLKKDPKFSSQDTWISMVLKVSQETFPVSMVRWFFNNCPKNEEMNQTRFLGLFSQAVGKPYAERTLKNGFQTLVDFLKRTIVGKELGFYDGEKSSFLCHPILPSDSFLTQFISSKIQEEKANRDLGFFLEDQSKCGGIIRVFGEQIRSRVFSCFELVNEDV